MNQQSIEAICITFLVALFLSLTGWMLYINQANVHNEIVRCQQKAEKPVDVRKCR